jgi:small-conductance mechanosensitive channel
MRVDISALWAKLQAMFDRALVLLPNLVLGALVFVLFLFAGKASNSIELLGIGTVAVGFAFRDILILFTQAVTVNAANEKRRSYDVGIGVGDDIEEARPAILRTILGVEGVLADGDRSRQREGWPAGTRKPVPKATRIGEALRGLAPGAAAERGP